ncbi:MAG TPA: type II secretion system F family protein [Propionibacteriaceae bacterium]
MTPLLAALAGLLMVGGLLAVLGGISRSWPPRRAGNSGSSAGVVWARVSRRPPGRRGSRRDALLGLSLVVGVVIAAYTGWVIALPLVPVLAFALPYLLVLPHARDVELLEALDRWVRSLASTLTTGKSIPDAIRISRRTAPALLNEELGVLVSRLNNRWETRDALMRFADALDSPDSDAVVAALVLAANRGSNGASVTLHALADSLQSQLKGRRVIETERSKPYVVVRQVTLITLVTLSLALFFGGEFFAPYGSPLGQVVLSVLISLYLGSLLLLRRQARQRPRGRILVGHET